MNRTASSIGTAAAVAMLLLTGCGKEGGTFYKSRTLGETDALVTSADVRLVMSTPVDPNGQRRIVCAEPSPDVAKAVQQSFGLGGSLGVDIPAQATGAAALSIAKARAEAIAQLGERLATIQLLRDGLYRACEAYANGAITKTTYAVLVSRYDDTMLSMLLGELAAGAFGRSLATAGGTADSSGSGSADLTSKLSIVDSAQKTADATQAEADKAEQEAVQAEQESQENQAKLETAQQTDGDHTELENAAEESKETADNKRREANIKLKTAAAAKTTATAVAAGAITPQQNPQIAEHLREMQRKYIENINSDALIVACITVLSEPNAENDIKLIDLCVGDNKNKGIIAQTMEAQSGLLQSLKSRSNLDHSVQNIKKAQETLNLLVPISK